MTCAVRFSHPSTLSAENYRLFHAADSDDPTLTNRINAGSLSDTFGLTPTVLDVKRRTLKKQRSKKTGPPIVLGIAWYREADWPRIKALFPNAGDLPDTYGEWLKTAEATVKRLNAVLTSPWSPLSSILMTFSAVHGPWTPARL